MSRRSLALDQLAWKRRKHHNGISGVGTGHAVTRSTTYSNYLQIEYAKKRSPSISKRSRLALPVRLIQSINAIRRASVIGKRFGVRMRQAHLGQ